VKSSYFFKTVIEGFGSTWVLPLTIVGSTSKVGGELQKLTPSNTLYDIIELIKTLITFILLS